MKTRDVKHDAPRHDLQKSHLIKEHRHDPYKARGKLHEPTVCSKCMAAFSGGRWRWTKEPLADASWGICPACHRIADKYPAGELTLTGSFLQAHAREITRLARNTEALEAREHPLQRIMDIDRSDDNIVITTTDIHLPRRIGHAIVDAYQGELETHYNEAEYFVRMSWRRDS
jgi:hypothetical protein